MTNAIIGFILGAIVVGCEVIVSSEDVGRDSTPPRQWCEPYMEDIANKPFKELTKFERLCLDHYDRK